MEMRDSHGECVRVGSSAGVFESKIMYTFKDYIQLCFSLHLGYSLKKAIIN